MPVRTRKKTAETPNKRIRKYKEPKQILQMRGRQDNAPKDEYYYLSFIWRNTVDDFQDTVDLIKSKGMPFEWAKSPSNCMCFRVLREYADNHPDLQKPEGKKYERACTAFMPYSCYGKEQLWQMEESNHFPYLYHTWNKVMPVSRRRRRVKG